MRLKNLVLLASLLYVAFIGGGIVLQRIFVVFPELEAATKEVHQSNVQSIYATFVSERESLISTNLDWSKWDDAYDYINGSNPDFIKGNVDTNSFSQMDIDAVMMLDMQGKAIYVGQKDYVKNTFKALQHPNEIAPNIDIQSMLFEDETYGIIQHGNRLAYYVSNYIQDSYEEKDANGVLVFIRDLKADFITRIELQLNVGIDIILATPDTQANIDKLKRIEAYAIQAARSHYLVGLADIKNKNIGAFSITYPEYRIPKLFDEKTILGILLVTILPLLITLIVYQLFLKPINHIYLQIHAMKNNNKPQRITKNSFIYEINAFTDTFNDLVDKIKRNEKSLITENYTDGLTKINNRKFFDKAYDESWRECTRNKQALSIVLVDIDYFKKYNDRYGHQKGDTTLIKVAQALNKLSRRAGDITARYGGEEFTLIVHTSSQAELSQLLESALLAITQLEIEHLDSNYNEKLTVSCGACFIEEGGLWMKDHKELALKLADEALYTSKEQGRNRFTITPLSKSNTPKA